MTDKIMYEYEVKMKIPTVAIKLKYSSVTAIEENNYISQYSYTTKVVLCDVSVPMFCINCIAIVKKSQNI